MRFHVIKRDNTSQTESALIHFTSQQNPLSSSIFLLLDKFRTPRQKYAPLGT